jgi:hypothetical protein
MLIFNVEKAPGFASDPETGEVFGLTGSPTLGELRGVYTVNGREYEISIYIEPNVTGTQPLPVPNPQWRLRIECSSIYFVLRDLLVGDLAKIS